MATAIKLKNTSLPGSHPNINTFVPALPAKNLKQYWLANSGITTSDSDVTQWDGFNGNNGVPGVPPEYIASLAETSLPGVKFTLGDNLATGYAKPDGDGYFVIAARYDAIPANSICAMGQGELSSTTDRMYLGFYGIRACFAVADLGFGGDQRGTTTFSAGDLVVIGLHIDGSTASLRVNGSVESSDTFTGGLGGGEVPFIIGGNPDDNGDWMYDQTAAGMAFYHGSMSGTQLDAIDAAMGALLGISL